MLIGDAAHASSPLMGQGGCMAMETALVLAEELHAVPDLDTAFAAYVARQAPCVKWVQQQSMATAEALRTAPAARDVVLRERGDAILRAKFAPRISPP